MDMSEPEEGEQLVTVPEAATEAGVTPQAIRNAIYEGKLQSRQMYGRQLITRADLRAYLKTRRSPGRPRKERTETPTEEHTR